mgnify:CR=1 FL=1
MKSYLEAYQELVRCGFIDLDTVGKHVAQQLLIDKILPDTASFFIITDIASATYPFVGSQLEVISGYSIDEFYSKGYLLLIQCMHPEERDVMMLRVLPELVNFVATVPEEEKKSCQAQFNCRFKRKNGQYINLLAQSYVLEVDQKGRVALALSSIIQLETREILPLRWSARLIKNNGISETAFIKTHNTSIDLIEKITPRELDVLRNLAAGKTSKLIGKELAISHHTVDTHRRRLLKKLDCKSVVDLARLAYRNGLI